MRKGERWKRGNKGWHLKNSCITPLFFLYAFFISLGLLYRSHITDLLRYVFLVPYYYITFRIGISGGASNLDYNSPLHKNLVLISLTKIEISWQFKKWPALTIEVFIIWYYPHLKRKSRQIEVFFENQKLVH